MRVLVTGASGFIGGHIATEVLRAGHVLEQADVRSGLDCRDFSWAGETSYDAVIHCAAVVGGRRVMDWTPIKHAANLAIDAALFEWAERTRPGRVVYFSSSCAYPEELGYRGGHLHENEIAWPPRADMMPDQLYGWTKLTGELLAATVRDAGVPVSVVRPFSVYGPGMNEGFAVRGFLEQVQHRADPIVIWGDAGQVRDYIHVDDVAGAVLAILEQGVDGPVNLGTGRGTSLTELATLMGRAAGYSPAITVDASMPAGVPSLVADTTRLHGIYQPEITLEDYLAGAI